MSYVLLVAGFVLLMKGADFFVEGSSGIAKMFHVPSLIIGMTIVAMGTSLPECAVSVTASLGGNNALAVSNAVGSNIFNLLVVCGACALFAPLTVQVKTLKQEFPFSMAAALLLLAFGYLGMMVSRGEGLVLLAIFAGFIVWMIHSAKRERSQGGGAEEESAKILPVWKSIFFIGGGAVAIAVGGNLVVDAASAIAANFGLSQNLIGLTIVAMGTSLPELVTSVVAARRNEVDMAMGNVIGSNIFNILFVLGLSSAISPISFIMENVIDIGLLTVMSLLAWVFAWTDKKIERAEGVIMLAVYAGYMAYIILR